MATPTKTKRIGRPPAKNGPLVDRPIGFSAEINRRLEELADIEDLSVPELVRRAVDEKLNPRPIDIDLINAATDSFRAPFLSRVPCGPWQDAVDEGAAFTVSKDVADFIEARDGDAWVEGSGDSMVGAGIQDGFMVLVRPLPEGRTPRRGEIAVIQAFVGDEEEAVLGTIKRWMPPKDSEGLPTLFNGDDAEFELPSGVRRVVAVAVGRAVLGRL